MRVAGSGNRLDAKRSFEKHSKAFTEPAIPDKISRAMKQYGVGL